VHLLADYIIRSNYLCEYAERRAITVLNLNLLPLVFSYTPVMTSTPAKRVLPSKESSLFRELLNLYETRQLKKGQKTADQILKKFPEHGGPYHLCMDKSV
jgi:hypothetical protein